MPEHRPGQLPDFPDVATAASRVTVPPRFEEIVVRAHRRRRRVVASVILATATLVGTVATASSLVLGDRGAAPSPVKPSPTASSLGPTPNPGTRLDATTIIQGGDLVSVAASGHSGVLTVWQLCGDAVGCRDAWQLDAPDGIHRGLVSGSVPDALAAGDRFVVSSWDRAGVVIDPSGHARPLREVADGTIGPGDVLVHRGRGLSVVDPESAALWPLPAETGTARWVQGAVATNGTVWAMPSTGSRISWSRDGATWQHHAMPAGDNQAALPGYLAVSGDHVAAMSGYDGATVLPVADLAVTPDGGRTWTDLHRGDLPFDYLDAMAATSGGTLYLVTPGGQHLYRSNDDTWTRFVEVPNPTHADSLVAAGDRVIARAAGGAGPTLVAFDDKGRAVPIAIGR